MLKNYALGVLLAGFMGLNGCSPKITKQLNGPAPAALALDAPLLVLGDTEPAPTGCDLLGTLRVGDTGVTLNCGLDRQVNKAKEEARKAGANILKITEIIPPNLRSTCYTVIADMLFAKDLPALEAGRQRKQAVSEKSLLPPGTPYALLYLYRPANFGGSAVSYDVYLNDSVVYHARYNTKTVIRLNRPGAVFLWTKNNTPRLPLQVEPGKEYFLLCGFAAGAFAARPWVGFVSTQQGRQEYEQIVAKP